MVPSHLPPVPSPLADCGRRPRERGVGFGAYATRPKCFKTLPLTHASAIPIMTCSATHSFRFTRHGIGLVALVGKALLDLRVPLRELDWYSEYYDYD
ncbi:hypothetical protein PGT21_002906 [Puccinia graminis f. sp. tritici]|uniref:Uncharacterized protein n=1 Tax=Puccinia graminis f. sp. tritici TaxID=56615 RepID=A0A5B0MM03_PUCGR|nr:hypothetical protein PGT21_002906 [Puccinia graminis f. sp. tritici]